MRRALSSFFLAPIVLLALSACSHQWREAEASHTPAEVAAMLDEVSQVQGQSLTSGDVSTALQMRNDSTIYFADAPSGLGGIRSLLSFNDFSFLGSSAANYTWDSIANARVFAFVRPSSSGFDVGLIVGVDQGNGFMYYGFSGQGSIDKDEFVATLNGPNGGFELRSYDVIDGDLADVIQFKVYQGDELLGQFSTLVAYTVQ